MDMTWAIDPLGEPVTFVSVGLLAGMLFGVCAQRSRFCMRAAVVELSRGTGVNRTAVWMIAFAGAVLGTQGLAWSGMLEVSEARQLASAGSLSGAIIGGLMFGAGMILTRGCPGRLLVLAANGNLRALLAGLVFAVVAQASLRGVLAPVRESLAGLWVVNDPSVQNALTVLGLGPNWGVVLAGVFMAGAILVAMRARLSAWAWIGGVGVGAAVALGWLLTYSLSLQAFDPVTVESLSFTGPSADMLMLLLSPGAVGLDFDTGMIPGVVLGSFLAALLGREIKLESFTAGYSVPRYIIGAVLLAFGGMLAGGCAIGAGVSGGAVFALTAWTALVFMSLGAAVTDLIVDRRRRPAADGAVAVG
ncbi:YeeE/YedE family protein [Rhodospira trueperi]|uniref:Sulphur transport n=1 Tax=Rhodospira trueperi TaxID=69960 RepID=A0A1G7GF29_9PROT|nr:YeeE/YedE family protein [Rhodospira trueperi]SDE86726.1 Sulphur transport [Rhodospira trueperi]